MVKSEKVLDNCIVKVKYLLKDLEKYKKSLEGDKEHLRGGTS